ncbi:fungal-specific transcription factor domain-containing protein [Infundibulicybe gibba]|nr:fungal-specific transcription factor domain-containing protein [Infundibulicybe gibba]
MDWRDSEPSDDEIGQDPRIGARKRSSRGPSYKRGPPKGYIHAIEQRWHQVEALLGAIIQCPDPRVQTIVSTLQQDNLAREIINRVDMGPYGPSGRRNQPVGATKEDFFASILKSSETPVVRDPSRSRRQSRVSREIVSSAQDHGLSVVPTQEWQDNLSHHLSISSDPPLASTFAKQTPDNSDFPLTQRRRLNNSRNNSPTKTEWNDMYTMEASSDTEDMKDPTEGIGQLSLDEHQEVRYHGQASGLHLLGRSLRTDHRIEGGVWRLPMARVWPPSKYHVVDDPLEDVIDVRLPPFQHKIGCWIYISPTKQAGGKTRQKSPDYPTSPRPQPSQEVTPLLLLSMFSISARFSEEEMPYPTNGKMWEAGCGYLDIAREILTKTFHRSRPSTVQSLVLLGYREFGIGSMEQGWIFIGMAVRMAMDLGLNCDSANWKIHGRDLFSIEESQTRRQIWWTCFLADRYGSIYMGRPILVKDEDFDTPLPDIVEDEEDYQWQPINSDYVYPPSPAKVMSSFCAVSTLSVIVGAIVTKIYPIRPTPGLSRRAVLSDLEMQLDQWYLGLPESLRYDPVVNKRSVPPPHILFLHIRYWGAVLLLHRALGNNEPATRHSTYESKAFGLAQGASSRVSAIVTVYRETFTLKRSSPFLTSYILSTSIMHIVTLTLRPANLEASLGLRQCMAALKEMEMVWPSAARAWEMLNGVKLGTANILDIQPPPSERTHKRLAEDAFGQEHSSTPQPAAFNTLGETDLVGENGVQDFSTRIMAHMLGLDIPGVEPSTSYYPGYEWWPRPNHESQPSSQSLSPPPCQPMATPNGRTPSRGDWQQNAEGVSNYAYDFGNYSV